MKSVKTVDLLYDPNEVGADLVVACLISQGPRVDDPTFDPQPGDVLLATDDDGEDLQGQVVRRAGNLVWLRLNVPGLTNASTP